jgi:hypothetical protein
MTLRGSVCGGILVLMMAVASIARAEPHEARPPVAVSIVPTSADGRTGDVIELFGDSHFHVVVTNSSGAPITLWKEWCSWGYFNLSFEARDASGRSFVISKKMRGWDKNLPCPIVIGPGRPWVIDVSLDPSIWQNSPLSSDAGKATLRLKAVFEIRKDESSEKAGVWTGKVSSPETEYTLYWPGAAAKATLRRLQSVRP